MVDKSSFVPMSVQIFDIICNRIIQGEYAIHSLLPSQDCFAKEFNVSSITVRRAFQELQARSLINSHRGKGTQVIKMPSIYQGFHTARGFTVDSMVTHTSLETKVLEIHASSIKKEASAIFQLKDEHPILIKRLRIIEGEPASLEFSYLNPNLLPDTNWAEEVVDNRSLYNFIEQKYSYTIERAEENILPIFPPSSIQESLKTVNPVLFIKRSSFVRGHDLPFEYCEYYILGEYYGRVVYNSRVI
ncbi:MAG: GntR family transcriptional regulator [Brevinema sp.]